MTTREEDATARLRALDPSTSFVVEALAGSGKTSLLTQRLLVLLARVDEPEKVLAVTFTRKAVEELRSRVLEALASVGGPVPDSAHERLTRALAEAVMQQDAAHGWGLLSQPSRLRIQTIDGLAASLARRLPLTAGIAAALDPADDASPLYERAARETLACLHDASFGDLVARALAVLDNDWGRAERLLVEMLPRRDQWLVRVVDGPGREAASQTLVAAVALFMANLRHFLPRDLEDEVEALAREAGVAWQQKSPCAEATALAGVSLRAMRVASASALAEFVLTRSGPPRKKPASSVLVPVHDPAGFTERVKDLGKRLEEYPEFCRHLAAMRELPDGGFSDALWAAVEALLGLLQLAAAQLDVVFQQEARCDFQAVAQGARQALGDPDFPTDFALAQDYGLEHLLVDEFQDTSRSQFEFFETLLGGWTGIDGRTVMLVGDPRQSIYRFRQAEVGLFTRVIADQSFAGVPLVCLRLSANFRTSEPLIEWLNRALPGVFASPTDRLPPFAGLVATRATVAGPSVQVHPLPPADLLAEANALLEIIREVRQRRPEASVAVLVRSRATLGLLPGLLAADGIPVEATDVTPLNASPVVNDLLALTRALVHLTDRIAWLAVLRAPWCGLSLPGLAVLVEGRPRALVWELINDPEGVAALSADDQHRLQALAGILAPALRDIRRMPWAGLVEATWQRLRGPLLVPVESLHSVQRYFSLLATFEERTPEFAPETWLATVEARFAPVVRQAGRPVQLMTIHKAKGLEFDVVILPGLERQVKTDDRPLVVWHELSELDEPGLLLAPYPAPGSEDTRAFRFVSYLDKQEQAGETRRLLYVAMTRARDELHLCARRALKTDGTLKNPVRGTFLELLWPRLVETFQPEPAAQKIHLRPVVPRRERLAGHELPVPVEVTEAADPAGEIEFDWATPLAKHVGTVTHLLLQLVAEEGLARWDPGRLPQVAQFARAELRRRGHAGRDLTAATERVMAALARVLSSERGHWVLSDIHRDAASELRLAEVVDGALKTFAIDRTFVTAEGTRWVIDFKTSAHLGGSVDEFMDREVLRYREQLSRYAELLHAQDPRPVMLALYFPLLDGWREWSWSAEA